MLNKNNYKILFISLYNDEAFGLRQLHSILHNQGYDTRMLFFKINSKAVNQDNINYVTDEELQIFKDYIVSFKPNLIAFSLVSSNFTLYKDLYKEVQKLALNSTVLVGGWQASLNPEDTLKYADIVCRGEGEEVVPELVDALANNKSVDKIKNLYTKNVRNPVRKLNQNLGDYPIIVLDNRISCFIENSKLTRRDPYRDNDRYGTIIGRGCPYHCTYCSNSFMINNIYGTKWCKIRYRNTENVIKELSLVKEELYKVKRINFYDEVFTIKNKEFFKVYKKDIALPFYCMFYPGTCNEEMARILKDAGLAGVWLGVQSASEYIRRHIFKRFYSNDLIIKQAEIFKKYGISVRYDFILDNPFEEKRHHIEFIQLLRKLPKPFSVNLFSLKYFPNTEITQMALENGYINQKKLDDNLDAPHHNYLVAKERREKLQELLHDEGITIV